MISTDGEHRLKSRATRGAGRRHQLSHLWISRQNSRAGRKQLSIETYYGISCTEAEFDLWSPQPKFGNADHPCIDNRSLVSRCLETLSVSVLPEETTKQSVGLVRSQMRTGDFYFPLPFLFRYSFLLDSSRQAAKHILVISGRFFWGAFLFFFKVVPPTWWWSYTVERGTG